MQMMNGFQGWRGHPINPSGCARPSRSVNGSGAGGWAWLARLGLAVAIVSGIPALGEAVVPVTLQWDNFDPDATGFIACYGINPGAYTECVDVGNETSHHFELPDGFNYYFVVLAYNALGLNSPFSAEVTTACCQLELTNPGSQENAEGDGPSLQILASPGVTYSASGLPPDLTINPNTGLISGVLSYSSAGTHNVTVSVSNGSTSASEVFEWLVQNTNRIPDVTDPGDRTDVPGATVALPITALDPDGDDLTFSQTGLPPDLAIHPHTGLISGVLGDDAAGTYEVTVFATDGDLTGSATFLWEITAGNRPPVLANPGAQSYTEKDLVSIRLQASDPEGDRLRFRAVGLPPGVWINRSNGRLHGKLRKGSAGVYQTTIFVSDKTHEVSLTFEWTISRPANRPPVLKNPGTQKDQVHDKVWLQVWAWDPDRDELTFSANGLPIGLQIDPRRGVIYGRLTEASVGRHLVTLSVSDGELSTSVVFAWEVSGRPKPKPKHDDRDDDDDDGKKDKKDSKKK